MKTRLVLASMGHRPELSINDRNVAFGLLEAGTRVADVARSFEGKENTIYCLQACFRQSGSKRETSFCETTDNDDTRS